MPRLAPPEDQTDILKQFVEASTAADSVAKAAALPKQALLSGEKKGGLDIDDVLETCIGEFGWWQKRVRHSMHVTRSVVTAHSTRH
jgi:hypothetical protein